MESTGIGICINESSALACEFESIYSDIVCSRINGVESIVRENRLCNPGAHDLCWMSTHSWMDAGICTP